MCEEEMSRLVSAVTEQVLRALAQGGAANPEDAEGIPRALVLGDASRLPEALLARTRTFDLGDYVRCGNILKYDRVVIPRMSTLQLSSLALGLPADDFCRAVMDALLNGVEVVMAEDAPEHRACTGKGSTALYQLLESYVSKLRVYGVKPLDAAVSRATEATLMPSIPPEQRQPRPGVECHARPNFDRLVTEATALKLCISAEETIRLGRGTLLTPAAKDVFAAAGVTVIIEA